MADTRGEILNSEYNNWVAEKGIDAIYPKNFPEAYKDAAINAMDENGRQMCMELLEYMANQQVDCRLDDNGIPLFIVGPILSIKEMTKEQLFENFL